MNGISSSGKSKIATAVEDIFDQLAMQLLGDIPRLRNKKLLAFSSKQNVGLANLFVQAMQNKQPNSLEEDALKSILNSVNSFVGSLKDKTSANLTEKIDALVKEAHIKNTRVEQSTINEAIQEEMAKARTHMNLITEAEATKVRNIGAMMDISRVASSLGDSDPTCFFVVVRDAVTCKECLRLHLADDGVTPRLYKFSEIKQGYHKRGEDQPCISGLHPSCRCSLAYLSNGYGFNKGGTVEYIGQGFDAYANQKS